MPRLCHYCGEEIKDGEEYITVGELDNPLHPDCFDYMVEEGTLRRHT